MLFRKDPKGLEHFRKVNDLLRALTDRMYKKGARIYRQYLISGVDETFDDDFMINTDLRFSYNAEESIANLGDEGYYGSDFHYEGDPKVKDFKGSPSSFYSTYPPKNLKRLTSKFSELFSQPLFCIGSSGCGYRPTASESIFSKASERCSAFLPPAWAK